MSEEEKEDPVIEGSEDKDNLKSEALLNMLEDLESAQKKIKESENKYRSMFQNLMSGFGYHKIVLDEKGKPIDYIFLDVNEAFENITGLKKEEIVGKKSTEVLPGTNTDFDWIGTYGKIALEGGETRFEAHSKPLNKWFSVSAYSPEKGHFITIFDDITERKNAEEMIKASEERYRLLFNAGNDAIYLHGIDENGMPSKFVQVNEVACRMLGYSEKELLNKKPQEIDDPEVSKKIMPGVMKNLTRDKSALFDNVQITKKGKKIPVEISSHLIKLNNKSLVLSVVRDVSYRKEAEEKIKESEKKYRVIFDSSPNAIVVFDTKARIIDTNNKVSDWLGYAKEDVIGKNILSLSFMDAKSKATAMKNFLKRIAGKDIPPYDAIMKSKDGKTKIGRVTATLLKDENNKLLGDLAILSDVTKLKDAEEARKANEEKFNTLYNSLDIGVVSTDLEGNFIDFNDAYLKLTGYSKKELLKKNFRDITPKKWHKLEDKIVNEKIKKKGFSEKYEKEYIKKDGTIISTLHTAWLTRDENGKPKGIWGLVEDITERKKAEEAIKDSENRFRTLFKNVPFAYFILNKKGLIVEINQATLDLSGHKAEELIGKHIITKKIVPKRESTRILKAISQVIKGNPMPTETYTLLTKDGEERICEVAGFPIKLKEESLALGTIRDITDEEKSRKELKESETKYRVLTETMNEGVLIVDRKGTVLYTNKAAANLVGFDTAEEAIGTNSVHFVAPSHRLKVFKYLLETITTNKGNLKEFKALKRNGDEFWVESLSNSVIYEDKKAILVTLRNIDEKKEIANRLAESEELYRLISENSSDHIALIDLNGKYEYISPSHRNLWDDAQSKIGQDSFATLLPEDRKKMRGILKDHLKGGLKSLYKLHKNNYSLLISYRINSKQGIRNMEARANLIWRKNTNSLSVLLISRDVTERLKAKKNLEASEEKYRNLTENINDIVYSVNKKGIVTYISPAAQKYNFKKTDLVGKRLLDLVHPEDRKRIVKEYVQTMITGKEFPSIFRVLGRNDEVFWFEDHGKVIRDKDGKNVGISGVLRDVTERVAYEDKIKRHAASRELLNSILLESEHEKDTIRLMDFVLKKTVEFSDADMGGIYLKNDSSNDSFCVASQKNLPKNLRKDIGAEELRSNKNYKNVLVDGKIFHGSDPKKFSKPAKPAKIKHILSIPIKTDKQVKGCLNLAKKKGDDFPEDEIEPLKQICIELSSFIDKREAKKAKEAAAEGLKISEDRFRGIVESSFDVIFEMDLKGTVKYISPSVKEVSGWEPKEIIGNNMSIFLKTNDKKEIFKKMFKLLKDKKRVEIKTHLKNKKGEFMVVKAHAAPRMLNGKLISILGSYSNVTREEEAIGKLRESEERFKLASEAGADLTYEWNIKTGELRWFGNIDEALGYKKGKIKHDLENWLELIHPDDRKKLSGSVYLHKKSTKQITETYRMKNNDGSWSHWTDRALPVLDENNKPVKWIGAITNITQIKKAEEDLRATKDELETVFENSNDTIVYTNTRGKVVQVNASVKNLGGYLKEEMLGASLIGLNMFTPKSKAILLKKYAQRLLGLPSDSYVLDARGKDGQQIFLEITGSQAKRDGKVVGTIATLRDVTDRILKEKQLKEEKELAEQYIDIAGVFIMVLDKDGKIKTINKKGCDILKERKDNLIGKEWIKNYIPQRNRKQVKKIFEQLISGKLHTQEAVKSILLDSNGNEIPIEWHNTTIKDSSGKITGTLSSGVLLDESNEMETPPEPEEKNHRTTKSSKNKGKKTIKRKTTKKKNSSKNNKKSKVKKVQ